MRCWHCGTNFESPGSGDVGAAVRCPDCGAKLGIPVVPPPPVSSPPPADVYWQTGSRAARMQLDYARELRKSNWGSVGVLVAAVVCFGISALAALYAWQVPSSYEHVRAVVWEKEQIPEDGCRTRYIATASFVAADGKSYYAETSSAASLSIGQSIDVYYNRADPTDNHLNIPNALWGYTAAWSIIGAMLLISWMISLGRRTCRGVDVD